MERQIAELRESEKAAKRAAGVEARERARARRDRAERLLDVAIGVLRVRPPAGIDVDSIDGFVRRHRGVLLSILRRAFA